MTKKKNDSKTKERSETPIKEKSNPDLFYIKDGIKTLRPTKYEMIQPGNWAHVPLSDEEIVAQG
jgi:hypothetical protein